MTDKSDAEWTAADASYNDDLEKAILSRMFADGTNAKWAVGHLDCDDFFYDYRGRIFEAIRNIVESEVKTLDITSIGVELQEMGHLTDCGGTDHLRQLQQLGGFENIGASGLEGVETAEKGLAGLKQYAKRLRELRQNRELRTYGDRLQQKANMSPLDVSEHLAYAQRELQAIQEKGRLTGALNEPADNMDDLTDWLIQAQQRRASIEGLRLGVKGVDKQLGGLGRQQLVILTAQTGFGKTTLATQALWTTATQARLADGAVLMLFAIEGGIRQVYQRWVAWKAQVDNALLQPGGDREADADENERIADAMQAWGDLPLVMTDEIADINEIQATIRNQALTSDIQGAVIDYAQLITGAPGETQERQYAHIAEQLQSLAKEIGAPILLPSQVTKQSSGEWQSKGAKAWQENASLVISLRRGEPGSAHRQRIQSGDALIACEKSRNQRPFSPVPCQFIGKHFRIWDREEYEKHDAQEDPFHDRF